MLIRKYWLAVKAKKGNQSEELRKINEDTIMDLYRDLCVCLVLYEIFIREFFEEEWELENEYMGFLAQAGEWLERICLGNMSQDEAWEFARWQEEAGEQLECYHIIRILERHERICLAIIQCVAFIALLNVEDYFRINPKKKITSLKNTYKNLIFKENGLKSKSKVAKDFTDMLENSVLFDDEQLDEEHPTVKNIFAFLDRISQARSVAYMEELDKLAWAVVAPVFDREGLLMKLDIKKRNFEKMKWDIGKAEQRMSVSEE